jgi:hypothetical protein
MASAYHSRVAPWECLHRWCGPRSSKPVEGLNKALCGFDSHTLPSSHLAISSAARLFVQRRTRFLPIPGMPSSYQQGSFSTFRTAPGVSFLQRPFR